ncbi:MAG: hypothetical protein DRQ62_01755 [Gammaproteobacteria bacterium]|nr:MAG: hypothetical protein DRQ62_01755 [Gammaproteobacteria bacterium]
MKISRNATRPQHIYCDNTAYFITAATWQHRRILNNTIKTELIKLLQEVFAEYKWSLNAWVILDNHYHVLCQSKKGKDLSKIINKVHNLSAQSIATPLPTKEKVWYNYWDYCPRDKKDYNIRLCYLLNNPVKHGYVSDLHDWPWSSFHELYKTTGREALQKKFKEYSDYRSLELAEDA